MTTFDFCQLHNGHSFCLKIPCLPSILDTFTSQKGYYALCLILYTHFGLIVEQTGQIGGLHGNTYMITRVTGAGTQTCGSAQTCRGPYVCEGGLS